MHLAAAVVLLLVLGVAAAAGQGSQRVSLTAAGAGPASGNQPLDTSSGIPTANLQDSGQTASGPQAAASTTGAATGGGSARATGPASGPAMSGPHTTYDDGASDAEVKVGGSTFTSGPAATYGEQIAVGYAAGVNYINDHGGINGRRMSVKIYDDGADPAKQLANIKRLVEVDHVFALSMAYAPIAGDYVSKVGIPLFLEGQYNEDFTNPWYFALGGPQMTSAMALAWYGAKTHQIKTMSNFYLDAGSNNYSRAFADKVASYWRAYGITVKAEVPFTPDQTSCSQGISEASGDKVDFVDFEIDAGHVIQCGVEAQIQGYKPPKCWGGYLIGVPVIYEALGDYSQCMYAFDAFGAEYNSADYINEVHKVSSKTDTNSSVTMGFFLSAEVAGEAMRKLGDTFTRAHLRDVMNTFANWRPPLTADPNQPTWTWSPTCHVAIRGGYLIQIHKHADGTLAWDQITPQGGLTPLPPGIGPPPELASCKIYADGNTVTEF